MGKVRIVERTCVDLGKVFVIQQRHFLFKWWWVDAWVNIGVDCICTFDTLEEANKNICYFNGTRIVDKVVKPI